MARQRSAGRKYQRPRHVGRAAPKLAVDEIGDTNEKDSDRPGGAGEVTQRKNGEAAVAGEQDDRQHAAEKAAVERHPALPELQALQRMRREIAGIVELLEAAPTAENDPERHPQH